jgi:hypothetical protein
MTSKLIIGIEHSNEWQMTKVCLSDSPSIVAGFPLAVKGCPYAAFWAAERTARQIKE